MTPTKLYTETTGRHDLPLKALIISPHGDGATTLLRNFPKILPTQGPLQELFEAYLRLEQDIGATEICKEAAVILEQAGVGTTVFTMDYPRGILDGGRTLEHCIRNVLPVTLSKELNPQFKKIHSTTIKRLQELYTTLNTNKGLLIDIHTMASFNPCSSDGNPVTQHITPHNLTEYVEQYAGAPRTLENLRSFDIITSDDDGKYLADSQLEKSLTKRLEQMGETYAYNHPYAASKHFMMYPNLTNTHGLCIDIPKHLLSKHHENPLDFAIEDFETCPKRIQRYGKIIADSLLSALS